MTNYHDFLNKNKTELISRSLAAVNRSIKLAWTGSQLANLVGIIINQLIRSLQSNSEPNFSKFNSAIPDSTEIKLEKILKLCDTIQKEALEFLDEYHVKYNKSDILNFTAFFSGAAIALAKYYDRRFDQSKKQNNELIKKLKYVKNDLQDELDATYQLIKDTPIAMAACNEQLSVEFWNPAATRLTGFKSGEIIKHSIYKIFTAASQVKFLDRVHHPKAWLKPIKLQVQRKTGGNSPVLVYLNRLKYSILDDYQYVISIIDLHAEEHKILCSKP